MKRFLLSQFPDESERSPNVVRRDVILALDVLERSAPGQAPHHDCDGCAGARNDGFAMGDSRIEDNAVRDGHGVLNDSALAVLVECNHQDNAPTLAGTDSLISDSVKASGRIDIIVDSAAISTLLMDRFV